MHKDMNITRALDYEHKFNAAKRKYVDDVFGADQLYLELLGTHPDFQLRGAGSKLVGSGIERGRKHGTNVTLCAEPTAEGFYLHVGFVATATISFTSVDGDQVFRFPVMAYDFGSNKVQQDV